jgi:hypothetical protein
MKTKKELFIESIDYLKRQRKLDEEFAKNMNKAFPTVFQANLIPNHEEIIKGFINMLKWLIDDKNDLIEVFIYDDNFGRREMVVTANGSKHTIKNAEDLWYLLNNEN